MTPQRFDTLLDAVRAQMTATDPAHDLDHVLRVTRNAVHIAQTERWDPNVVHAAALCHELFNYPKHHPDSSRSGDVCAEHALALLRSLAFDDALSTRASECIRVHAFSKGVVPDTLDARILQDADRLDAIGAIGIARCFATCATMQRPFYAPVDPFCAEREPDDTQWGVDHFYRKLLRLADAMHTTTARKMARERGAFLKVYLAQLEREVGSAPATRATRSPSSAVD